MTGASPPAALIRVRVWDLPTRVVHWLIAILVGVSWWTHRIDAMHWHRLSGYTIIGLVLFRFYWGFVGSTTARFSSFVRGPKAFVAYARRLLDRARKTVALGHNPMGGWSVLALLGLLAIQAGLGLFSVDTDGLESGPLASLVSFDAGRRAAHLHHLTFNILLVFIGLHLGAVVFYLIYRRDNLISPMVGGYKRVPEGTAADLNFAALWRALIGATLSALVTVAVATRGFHLVGS